MKSNYRPSNDGECLDRDFVNKMRLLGEKYYGNKIYGEYLAYQHELQDLIKPYAQKKYQEAEKAYGGCHNCYGKGYATQSSSARGRGISWDTSGPVFCGCDRGEQLETLMKEGELNGAEAFSVQLALAFMDDEAKAVIKTELEDYKSFKSQLERKEQ